MKIGQVRVYLKPDYTISNLYLNEENGKGWYWFCNVLEDTVRESGIKIDSKTAIPYGIYDIEFRKSPTFGRIMPYLKNVPDFTNVMVHWGNTAEDTSGCLLLGLNTKKGMITNSWITWNKFIKLLDFSKQYKIQIVKSLDELQ